MAVLQRQESKPVLHAWTQLAACVEVGPEYELGISSQTDVPLRTVALARLFIIDRVIVRPESLGTLVSPEYQSIGDALMFLAAEDPDTCCAALETLETIVQKASVDGPAKPISLLLAHVYRVVLNAIDPEVISKAQSVLADALNSKFSREEFFSLITDAQLLDTLTKLEDQCLSAPPSNMQSALHLLGYFLDHAHQTLPSSRDVILAATARYIRLLRMTIIDANPFDTRFAAAQSIRARQHFWTTTSPAPHSSPLVLSLGLVLYDMLQDDDDEIRDVAAFATSTFLSARTEQKVDPTVPVLATQHLLTHLLSTFRTSMPLATHALRRLVDTPSPDPLFSIPFAEILEELVRPSTALFAQEKQNLFRDDVLDALSWARVVSTSSLLSSLPSSVIEASAKWTYSALTVLTTKYEIDVDGALGWASKSEVFTWLIRIVCPTDAILQSSAKGKTEVKLGLTRLVRAMEKGEGHGVVVKRAEKVLEDDVLRSLGILKGVAKEAPEYAVSWLEA